MTRRALIYFGLYMMFASCTEPYHPKLASSSVNLLVVDGALNTTDSVAQVKLSRAISLGSTGQPSSETGAKVTIEEQNGSTVTLVEESQGLYSAYFPFSVLKQYRVSIITSDGKKYSSDFVTAYKAPAIDTLLWKPEDGGISVFINTHDPTNQTRYYHWTFNETWEYSSPFIAELIKQNGKVEAYSSTVNLNTCWTTAPSQTILTYSTTAFSEDRVSEFPITFLQAGSQRLSTRYSIEVKQQAISQEEYNFWQQLQSTSQNLGSIFDPMPTQVIGNIHNESDSTEFVLGYFTAGSYTTKRIFIAQFDLPQSLKRVQDFSTYCALDSVSINYLSRYPDGTLFVSSYGSPFPIGYIHGSPGCIDCRAQGGSIVKPSFWK